MKAIWNGATIAHSHDTIVVEGNHYFPASSVEASCLVDSAHQTTCPWKGQASYKSIHVNGETNADAAWYYPAPLPAASQLKDRFAFWHGVEVVDG